MVKKIFLLLIFLSFIFSFSQQNEEFKSVKKYYDYHRTMLKDAFKKTYNNEKNVLEKSKLENDFVMFMEKMDSIQNTAFIGALIKVKNREDLIALKKRDSIHLKETKAEKISTNQKAEYPGGFDILRSQVAKLFYTNAVLKNSKIMKANVMFVVDEDGNISFVKAEGDNFSFNRQAEIAMYMLPEKFSPAKINGHPVKHRFRLPLTMNFDN